MSNYKTLYLPQFTIGADAFENFGNEMSSYGSSVAIIHGERAWQAASDAVRAGLAQAGCEITCELLYGQEATQENADRLMNHPCLQRAAMILGVGGGKCIDTAKYVAAQLKKPVFTVPTIASNCAPVTKLSVLYHQDGSLRQVVHYPRIPVHCFINPTIILKAPVKYLWAGIGDAIAKHVECTFSAQNDPYLNYGTVLGKTVSALCFEPLLQHGKQALEDAAAGVLSEALVDTILHVIISPGITSVSVDRDYNEAVAHALFYGFSCRAAVEQQHLHGEIVAYGTLVNLLLDGDTEKFRQVWAFNRQLGLPTTLAELGLSAADPLEDVLEIAFTRNGMRHLPYPITAARLRQTMQALEGIDCSPTNDYNR